jgi:ligand-binding sensor domain-containing protein
MIRLQTRLQLQYAAHGSTFIGILLMGLVFSCRTRPLHAQESYYIKTYTTESGLPQNSILGIAQDKTGFLWIATWDGLSRFDGYEFHNYFHNPEDSTTIPYFIVSKVRVDRYNRVWIYSRTRSLTLYIRATDSFRNFSGKTDPELARVGVDAIETDDQGDLWVAGSGGIARYDSKANRFISILMLDSSGMEIRQPEAYDLSFDNKGGLWLITGKGILFGQIRKQGSKDFFQLQHRYNIPDLEQPGYPSGLRYHWQFWISPDTIPWLFSNTGCFSVNARTGKFDEFTGPLPADLGCNQDNLFWVRNRSAFRIYGGAKQFVDIPLFPGEIPQVAFKDNSGSIWYGCLSVSGFATGLHSFTETPEYFRHYMHVDTDSVPVAVYSVYKDNQENLWVGSQDHDYIDCIKPDGRIVKVNVLDHQQARLALHPRAIVRDSKGIWIGYMQQRLDFYNFSSGSFLNIYTNRNRVRDDSNPWGFRSLFLDSNGNLLVGTHGLYVFDPQGQRKFRRIWNTQQERVIFSLNADAEGNIWAGASNSLLLKFDKQYNLDASYVLSDNYYNPEDICFGENGELWIGLLGGGLCRFDPITGHKEFFTTEDGLSNNTIYSVLKDKRGNIWLSTNNGISRFNPHTRHFRIFGSADGLKIHEFNSDAAFQTPRGEMFFGGMGGVVGFYPDSIDESIPATDDTPLVLTEFQVSGAPRYFNDAIYDLKTLSLNKGDDNFGITFACLNFKNAKKIKYRYRLSGFSPEWKETDYLHRHVNFAGLSPGAYWLNIEATDNEGYWSIKRRLQIVIPSYFYQTLWFKWLAALLTSGVFALMVVLYIRQIRLKEKNKQDQLRLEGLRGQMNPHFVFNSLNSINYFISNSDRLSANRYITSFSRLIRSILNHMSHEYINLADEIASLEEYLKLEFLRFGDKFDYSINTEALKNAESWEVYPGMLQPFIENAIWHGVRGLEDRKGFISISFNIPEKDRLQCLITDDGIGRARSHQYNSVFPGKKSQGIEMVQERLRIVNSLKNKNYRVMIEDFNPGREECGTRVLIDLPVRLKV